MVPNLVRQKPPHGRKTWVRWPCHSLTLVSRSLLDAQHQPACLSCLVHVPSCGEEWGPRRVPFSSLVLVPPRRCAAVSPQSSIPRAKPQLEASVAIKLSHSLAVVLSSCSAAWGCHVTFPIPGRNNSTSRGPSDRVAEWPPLLLLSPPRGEPLDAWSASVG